MSGSYLLVCYDVVSDARRGRLHRGLKGLLQPVQKSVFEGWLPRSRLGALQHLVQVSIDHGTDSVRIYHLCGGCQGRVELIGVSLPVGLDDDDVVL